ncbi:MAG: SusC/RagA family TonB-linked outer membrane protein [Chryseosolibacter sp.]
MKKLLLLGLTAVLMLASSELWAQDRQVAGRVTDAEDGSGLPGVNVVLQGTTNGTVTDAEGSYSLNVPQGDGTLVFTFVGMATQEVQISGRSEINVVMSTDVAQLSEVVVTAMNIPREKASLGYATQTLDNEAVTTAKQQNFVNSLSGKLAGVQVRTNSNFGGSTNIVIRGNKSVSGNNQPLFVVDGVPIDNRTGNTASQQAGSTGYDYGNAASDINPEDIESINILKGAAASALYGSRAANGVVMITTKKGKARKGVGISISSGVTVSSINKETFADYQDKYGAGYAREWFHYYDDEGDGFFKDDVNGDGTVDFVVPTLEDGSYGAPFNPNLNVYHWDSFVPESPNYMKAYPWTAAKHTPVDFFDSQTEFNNSIAFSGGNETSTFRASYTNYQSDWILPNSKIQRHNFGFNGSTKINEKLTANVGVNYIFNKSVGRGSTGYSDNLMTNFRQWWQTNVDVYSLRDMYMKTGRNITWNPGDYYDPETPIFWDNPYWTRYKNYQTDNRSRVFGNFQLDYKIADWLNLMGRVAVDNYSELREERRAVGSIPAPFGINRLDEASGYQREDRRVAEYNYDAMLTATKDLSTDLSLVAVLGTNIRRQTFNRILASTNGGLAVPNLYSINNSLLALPLPVEQATQKEVYGYFANLNLGFRDFLYLDVTGRNDISSALPVKHNSYFYHSEALSIVFSELLDSDFLDFGKVRVNYAEVGNDTDAERTQNTYPRVDNFGQAVLYSFPTYVNNPELESERTKSWEVGLELAAVDNRLTLDLGLYKTNSINQIVEVAVSKATGYGYKYLNGGDIQNKGLEVALGFDIVKNADLTWNASVNWSKNISIVNSLPAGIENYVINSFQGGVSANATVGYPYGVIRGTGYQYLNGRRVINSSGYYVAVADQVIGDPNPDWTGGFLNSIKYKNLNFSFLVDVQRGGDVWSLDMHYGQGTGILENTAGLNDLGNPIRDLVTGGEDSGGFIQEGVQADGSENTVRARADYYGGAYYWGSATRNPSQLTTYDASYVKLREVSLAYNLPTNILGNVFQNASLSLVGRNLWIIHKNLPYADPESGLGAGNGQGFISGAYPATRSIGVKLDLTF